jgi:hypothetical protein
MGIKSSHFSGAGSGGFMADIEASSISEFTLEIISLRPHRLSLSPPTNLHDWAGWRLEDYGVDHLDV